MSAHLPELRMALADDGRVCPNGTARPKPVKAGWYIECREKPEAVPHVRQGLYDRLVNAKDDLDKHVSNAYIVGDLEAAIAAGTVEIGLAPGAHAHDDVLHSGAAEPPNGGITLREAPPQVDQPVEEA